MIVGQNVILSLPKFDFDVSKIELDLYSSSKASSVNIYVNSEAVSTAVTGNKTTQIFEVTKSPSTDEVFSIKNTGSALNINKIKIFKSKSSKTSTSLSFNSDFDATKTYTFRNGIAPSDYTKPTVTFSPAEATGNITYTSSDEDVVSVGEDGTLDFTGKTKYDTEATITVKFVATGDYADSEEISYNVKNVEAKASLVFSESSVTVMQGKESEFTAPTLTLTDAEGNPVTLEDNDVYYESTKEAVVKVNDPAKQEIEFVNPGTAEIKATYIGSNKDYENLTASYTLVYKEKEKTATTVEFTSTDNSVNIEDGITVKAVVMANGSELVDATVTYSASNDNVMVDENSGYILGVKEGTSTITATFAGNADYAASSSEPFEVTVTDHNKKTVTFDFSKPEDYGYTAPTTSSKKTELEDGNVISKDGVILTNVKGGTTTTRFTNASGEITFRIYSGVNLTLSAPDGYVINNVLFYDNYKTANIDCDPGVLTSSTQTWNGLSNLITITIPTASKYAFFKTMTVTCIKKKEITLGEGTNDKVIDDAVKITDNLFDVTLNRTMQADGGWYTFSVPFDIADVSTTPLKDAEIRQYKSMTGSIMNFEATTSLKAVHAYLVKPTTDIANPVFQNVTVSLGDNVVDGADGYEFVGIYSDRRLETDGTNLFLGADNKFYVPTSDDCTLKALRGYFVAPSADSGAKMSIDIDGNTTSISALNSGKAIMNGRVYNLNGQYVGKDVKALQKGIYMVNGKKYIVK